MDSPWTSGTFWVLLQIAKETQMPRNSAENVPILGINKLGNKIYM